MGFFFGLLSLALVGGILFWLIGLPIILLIRTSHLQEILKRLERLEKRQLAPAADIPLVPPLEEPPTEAAAVRSTIRPPVRKAIPDEPARRRPAPVAGVPFDWEGWIGRRGLGWLAGILLILAVAFFLSYAFENGWIGPLGQVCIGLLIGIGLVRAGLAYHRKGAHLFSTMLTGTGSAILYLTTWASFGYYQLLPRDTASLFLVLIIVEVAGLALLYDSMAIALLAVVGGLATPLLLVSDRDLYQSFFTYLGLLNLGVVILLLIRAWPVVGTVALLGTQALFATWVPFNYHPEKLPAALLFQGVLFAIYLLPVIGSALRHRSATVLDLIRLLINSSSAAIALHFLLYEDYYPWLGCLALGLALVHALLAWFVSTCHPADQRQLFVLVAIVLSLIAVAWSWQAEVAWVAVGWAVEGAALWWTGLRLRTAPLRAVGAVLLILAVGRLLFVDTLSAHQVPFVPIFNTYAIPALIVAGCVILAATVSRYSPLANAPLDRFGMWAFGVSGVLLIWFLLSFETSTYFTTQVRFTGGGNLVDATGRSLGQVEQETARTLQLTASMALSLVWGLYAAVILAIGFLRHNPPLRWTALGLFGLTLAKVVLVDLENLPGFYRIAVFLALAIVLALAARVYQRKQPQSNANVPETSR